MRATPGSSPAWLAGALGLALLAGPAAGQGGDAPERSKDLELRVPVQIKQGLMKSVRVDCAIVRGQELVSGHKKSEWQDIKNGEFNQVVEFVMTPVPGKTIVGSDQYSCHLEISTPGAWNNGRQGTPTGPDDPRRWDLARPDQFFQNYVGASLESGKVDGGKADGGKKTVDGIVGPKDLTIGPKSKDH
jgi:hypothetical protein